MSLRCDRCYWCGTETFSPRKVGPTHPKTATVDHLRSKPECVSGKEYHHHSNKVNACYECNQRRSLEWCRRRDAGLVHPTEWSLRQAKKESRRQARKKARRQQREFLNNCKPCPVMNITVPQELETAYAQIGQ